VESFSHWTGTDLHPVVTHSPAARLVIKTANDFHIAIHESCRLAVALVTETGQVEFALGRIQGMCVYLCVEGWRHHGPSADSWKKISGQHAVDIDRP
jgi:hypothetical protein